jgi:hypothetical protein
MQSLMKFVLFGLLAVFGTTLAIVPGQAESDSRVLVDIPFDFSVGITTLKAGSYLVQDVQSRILALSSNDGQVHQFVLTVPEESANRNHQPKLVFTRYGDEVFLNTVFLSGNDDGRQLLQSSREKQLIQKGASGEKLSLLIQPAR